MNKIRADTASTASWIGLNRSKGFGFVVDSDPAALGGQEGECLVLGERGSWFRKVEG
jgi:hypothetical protein